MLIPVTKLFKLNKKNLKPCQSKSINDYIVSMKWINAYSTGATTLDDHHQEIFDLISQLDVAVSGHSRNQIEDVLIYLESYVVEHFEEEETLMKNHDFSGLSGHEAEHAIFKSMILEIRNEYNQDKLLAHLAYKLRRFVDTLISHIISTDVKIRDLEDHHAS